MCSLCDFRCLEENEIAGLKQIIHKDCQICSKPYSRGDRLELKDCFCNICPNCQCEKCDSCVKCDKEFPQTVKTYLAFIKYEKDEEERRRKLRFRECGVCTNTVSIEKMRGLGCGHYFCEPCLKDMLEYYITGDQLDKATSCPHEGCGKEIGPLIIQDVLTKDLWNKLNTFLINKAYTLISCPNCREQFEAPESRKAICFSCKHEFCKNCCESWHEQGNCQEIFILRRIKELEDNGEIVSQCPGCKFPYIKDDGCEHVECRDLKCKTVFCFTCACIRSPTMVHGNHFHRPECKWFGALPPEEKDEYLPDKCSECKRLGELCKPPKQLLSPRKFGPGET